MRTWTLPVPVHATRYVRAMLMHVLCTRVRPVTGRCHRCSPPRRPRLLRPRVAAIALCPAPRLTLCLPRARCLPLQELTRLEDYFNQLMIEREAQLAIERKKARAPTCALRPWPPPARPAQWQLHFLLSPCCGSLRGTGGGAGAGTGAAGDAPQGGHDAAEDVARPQREAGPREKEGGREEGQGRQRQEEEVARRVWCVFSLTVVVPEYSAQTCLVRACATPAHHGCRPPRVRTEKRA